MKSKRRPILLLLKIILPVLPFCLGYLGFSRVEGVSPSWAAYYALRLYGLNTDLTDINPLIELARWTAPIATATTVLLALEGLWQRLRYRLRALRRDSCSVYGNTPEARQLLESLGRRGICGDLQKPLRSRCHVVLADDNRTALDFYSRWADRPRMRQAQIFLHLRGISPMAIQQSGVTAFSLEESCAAAYWANHPLACGERIALIGGGALTDALLAKGLLVNILSPDQGMEYHVWGSDESWRQEHLRLPELTAMAGDRLIFHTGGWQESLPLLCGMDRILLSGPEDENLTVGSSLLSLCPAAVPLHLYSRNPAGANALLNGRALCFGDAREMLTADAILREEQWKTAKAVNEAYRNGREEGRWENLSTFLRQSNVSTAEYFPVLRRLAASGLSDRQLVTLEHIRWCRFHYLYNWSFGPVRDNEKRLHPCLAPDGALSEEDRRKDAANVELALGRPLKEESHV